MKKKLAPFFLKLGSSLDGFAQSIKRKGHRSDCGEGQGS